MSNENIMPASAVTSGIQYSYLSGGTWKNFNNQIRNTMDGIKIQTSASSAFYLQYRTLNKGVSYFYPFVKSTVNDYAGSSGKPIQQLEIQAFKKDGTKLTSGIIVMYRTYTDGKWLPWVSNADPEWMRSVHKKYNLDGTLDTSGFCAGIAGKNISGVEIRVYEESSIGDFTGGEANGTFSYMVDSTSNWNTFERSALASHIDGVKIQTSASKGYYLTYMTWNEGQAFYYPEVKSTVNDYAGYPGKPIQRLSISAYKNDGTKLASGVIVMYRAYVDGRWLPWVSNADPEWMRNVQSKYSLGGTLDTSSSYAGIDGKNISGIEIRIFEEGSLNAGAGSFDGNEVSLSTRYMVDSTSKWTSFTKSAMAPHMDGLEIRTTASQSFYLTYKTWNAGQAFYYPEVTSTGTDYAGSPGKPIQRLSISVYKKDGTKLTSGVVVMYRAYVDGRWLPWVSNADPEYMRSVKSQYNLDGALDVNSSYAGIDGKNIAGIEIRAFEGQSTSSSIGNLSGNEAAPTLSYIDSSSTWHSFSKKVSASNIGGIKIQTGSSKPYYLLYRTWNAGKSYYYPSVKSTENDYAGSPGKTVQLLNIQAYRNDGTKITTGVVVMYRVYADGRWLPWVSNADPEWMRSVKRKYDLDGTLDTSGYYAGIDGKNIGGVEIRVFEEKEIYTQPNTPTGNYKIIQAPFISQLGKYPTGCESVTAVMALRYAGFNVSVDTFIDSYLDKSGVPFNPNYTFGGNPRSTSGYGCYAPVIKKALDKALTVSTYTSKVLTQVPLATLCSEYIDKNIPVILWATMYMNPPYISSSWKYNGMSIDWVAPEHCLLLVGYDDTHYIFNDPLQSQALTYYSKAAVEAAYRGLNRQAVVIVKDSTIPTPPEEKTVDVAKLERIDRNTMMNTYYYAPHYNATLTRPADQKIPDNFNDYNILACLQLLYTYFYDQKDFEKTDMLYNEMLTLRKLNPSYRKIYAEFLNSSGEFDMGYQYYAPGRKTTKIRFDTATYFTVDTIREMHRRDDWMAFIASLIPGVGAFLDPMIKTMGILEQSGLVGLSDTIIDGLDEKLKTLPLDVLLTILDAPDYVSSALSTFIDFTNIAYGTGDKYKETYIKDGVTIQEGDSYISVRLYYDMGIEFHQFRFYFRNGYPLVTNLEQFVFRSDTQSIGGARGTYDDYAAEGYVPSEKHLGRGYYWPGEK